MKASDPVKHKTPNYRLRTYTQKIPGPTPHSRKRTISWSLWEKQPLRSTRKDLP